MRDEKHERTERSIELRNEPSPLLRLFAIAAVRIEGDFEFDEVRTHIHSPQWIAEAKNQEDRHERYVLMTAFILDMLFVKIEELKKDASKKDLVDEYASLEGEMHSCDVINLKCTMTEEGNDHHFTASTYASDKKDAGKGKEGKVEMKDTDIKVDFTEDRYSEGMDIAKENGYRRINCTARNNYRKAMRLAVSSGFFDPNKALSIRKNMVRAEDFSR